MEPKALETCWLGIPRSKLEIAALVRALFVSNAVSSELRKAIAALAGRWSNTECVEGCGLGIQNYDFYVGRTTDGHYGRASRV